MKKLLKQFRNAAVFMKMDKDKCNIYMGTKKREEWMESLSFSNRWLEEKGDKTEGLQ